MSVAPASSDPSGNYNFRMPSATGKQGGCAKCDEEKRKMMEKQNQGPVVGGGR